jgi:hypothetical protein
VEVGLKPIFPAQRGLKVESLAGLPAELRESVSKSETLCSCPMRVQETWAGM